jgi:hypothetical protein
LILADPATSHYRFLVRARRRASGHEVFREAGLAGTLNIRQATGLMSVLLTVAAFGWSPARASASSSYPVVLCGLAGAGLGQEMTFSASPGSRIAGRFSGCAPGRKGPGIVVFSRGRAHGRAAGAFVLTAPTGLSFTGLEWSGEFQALGGWSAMWRGLPATGPASALSRRADCGYGGFVQMCKSGPRSWQGSFPQPMHEIQLGIFCHARRCSARSPLADFGHPGFLRIARAVVTVTDPQDQPILSPSGSLWQTGDPWISATSAPAGGWSVRVSASDPAGVCGLRAFISATGAPAGSALDAATAGDVQPDDTSLLPCGAATVRPLTWSPASLADLANGAYALSVQATNPAGGQANQQIPFQIDNQPPPGVTGLKAALPSGPDGWSPTPDFDLSWTVPADLPGPQSPVLSALTAVCDRAGTGCTGAVMQPIAQTIASVGVPVGAAPGVYEARVTTTDQAGNVSGPQWATLKYDPSAPSAVSLGPSRPSTVGMAQLNIPETVAATAGPSGVYGYQVTIDSPPSGGVSGVNCFGSYDISNLTTGTHTLYARAFSGAGVAGPVSQVVLNVDRGQP